MSARPLAQRQPTSDPSGRQDTPTRSRTGELGSDARPDVRYGLVLLLVAQAAVITTFTIPSGFINDDFVNLWVSRVIPFGWTYLTSANYDHFGLGQRLLHHVVLFLGRGRWEAVVAAQVLLGALTTWTVWRLARLVSGSERLALAAGGFTAFSPLWANTWIWWSAAADMVLAMPCMLLVLECAVRRLRGGPRWLSLAAAAALAVALTSRERPVVFPAILMLLSLIEPPPTRISSAAARLRVNWDLWIATGLVAAVFLVVDLRYMASQLPGKHPWAAAGGSQVASFMAVNFTRLFLPSLVGVLPVAWNNAALTAVAATAALVAILVTVLGIRGSWKAWALFLASMVLVDLPLALGRAGNGDYCAVEPRYSIELLPFIVTTFALLGALARAGGTRAWLTRFLAWSPLRPIGVGAVGGLLALSLASTHLYERAWLDATTTARRFRQTVASLPPGARLLDGTLPPRISPVAGPWDALSIFVSWARPDVRIGDIGSDTGPLLRIAADGSLEAYERTAPPRAEASRLVRARAAPERNGPPARATPGERAFVGVDAGDLKGAEAVLLSVVWKGSAAWWNPTTLLDSEARFRAAPVLAGFTRGSVQAIVPLAGHETAVGFEVPASAADDVQRVEVIPLRKLSSPR